MFIRVCFTQHIEASATMPALKHALSLTTHGRSRTSPQDHVAADTGHVPAVLRAVHHGRSAPAHEKHVGADPRVHVPRAGQLAPLVGFGRVLS